jgi:hypothetical protein
MNIRTIIGTGVVIAVAAVGVLGIASTASAAGIDGTAGTPPGNSTIKKETTSFNAPSTQSLRVDTLHRGDQVDAVCYREGQKIDGSAYWFKIDKNDENHTMSYVHLDAISAPKDLPHCTLG